jgi:putative phosphoribosyl transferase
VGAVDSALGIITSRGCFERPGFGTLLFDLLIREEDESFQNRFNIDLLTERLTVATNWILKSYIANGNPNICYFGASTGAAAALGAAPQFGEKIKAVVSRGGRPDPTPEEKLRQVETPTMLIVSGNDAEVLQLNVRAFGLMSSCRDKRIEIVPGATHLFEEPGALEEVARLATGWFAGFARSGGII